MSPWPWPASIANETSVKARRLENPEPPRSQTTWHPNSSTARHGKAAVRQDTRSGDCGRYRAWEQALSAARRASTPTLLSRGPVVAVVCHRADGVRIGPPASDRPLLPFQLGRSRLSLNAVGLLPQPVDSTPSSEFVHFQQSNNRRHPRPPGEQRPNRPPLPRNHHSHPRPAETRRSRPERQQLLTQDRRTGPPPQRRRTRRAAQTS
jgi:hypothetical protein